MKKYINSIIVVSVLSIALFISNANAQRIFEPDAIQAHLNQLEETNGLNEDERSFLQKFFEDHGLPSIQIVGGSNADIADHPWMVSVATLPNYNQYCGGSIIDEEWILTAAHCLDGSQIGIRAGVTNRNDWFGQGQDRVSAQIIIHEDYVHYLFGKDIALVRVSEPFDFSDPNVTMIPISNQLHSYLGFLEEGVVSTITGWGRLFWGGPSSDILQEVDVPIVSNEQAQVGYPNVTITDDMLAAGLWGEGGIDACQGDSGGPLIVPDDSSPVGFVLAGITSWGEGCAEAQHMGIYARVPYFAEWIEDNSDLTLTPPIIHNHFFTTSTIVDTGIYTGQTSLS